MGSGLFFQTERIILISKSKNDNMNMYLYNLKCIEYYRLYVLGGKMCFYIGIEDLVANALIEIVDKTGNKEVSFQKLNDYGAIVIRTLNEQKEEAILLLSRDRTNEFIHNCTEFFEIRDEENGDTIISLKEGVTTNQLRMQFRTNIAFDVLLAFVNEKCLQVLGV